jgi:hypothetical protein
MANNYLQFSASLDDLTSEEAKWLEEQLAEDENHCPVFLRDHEDSEDDDYTYSGFECEFQEREGKCYLWLVAEESGAPGRVAHLVQKFLKRFRPDQCWSLTYATTCSKPRVGEFGGGAVFVTADEVRWQNAYEFIAQQQSTFKAERKGDADCQAGDAEEAVPEEEQCAESPTGRHLPDPRSIRPADGAARNRGTDWLVDVNCLHCGCSGSLRIDPDDLHW